MVRALPGQARLRARARRRRGLALRARVHLVGHGSCRRGRRWRRHFDLGRGWRHERHRRRHCAFDQHGSVQWIGLFVPCPQVWRRGHRHHGAWHRLRSVREESRLRRNRVHSGPARPDRRHLSGPRQSVRAMRATHRQSHHWRGDRPRRLLRPNANARGSADPHRGPARQMAPHELHRYQHRLRRQSRGRSGVDPLAAQSWRRQEGLAAQDRHRGRGRRPAAMPASAHGRGCQRVHQPRWARLRQSLQPASRPGLRSQRPLRPGNERRGRLPRCRRFLVGHQSARQV